MVQPRTEMTCAIGTRKAYCGMTRAAHSPAIVRYRKLSTLDDMRPSHQAFNIRKNHSQSPRPFQLTVNPTAAFSSGLASQ